LQLSQGKERLVPYIHVGEENSASINLYYEDHGSGSPVVLIHGWMLSGASWEKQVPVLLDAGYRVITYDRRGFGDSSKPASGYDFDTFAQDLDKLMTGLDLHDATLVGFSMGAGECARYLSVFGAERVSKVAFLASILPFLLKTPDNPGGVDESVFEEIRASVARDRYAFASGFLANYYNTDVLGGQLISDEVVRSAWNLGTRSSPIALAECVPAWLTDFRDDLLKIDVPALVLHGDSDRILPIASTGDPLQESLKGSQYIVVEGGPHGLLWTHAEEVNRALIDFLG
jgi:non-heme chloroperoxidase